MMIDPITGRYAGAKGGSLLMVIDPITGLTAPADRPVQKGRVQGGAGAPPDLNDFPPAGGAAEK